VGGGGRWTQYLLSFNRVYAVDYHQELLDELASTLQTPNLIPIRNDGLTLPGVADHSVDYVLSFGVFVHLDQEIRDSYLAEIERVLTDNGLAVIQYSEKLKPDAAANSGFAENTAADMRARVIAAGLYVLEENLTFISHSNVIVFRRNIEQRGQWAP
jgi:cyclopropane fatty-acyl-phospholipid synthase-like methyltransferase